MVHVDTTPEQIPPSGDDEAFIDVLHRHAAFPPSAIRIRHEVMLRARCKEFTVELLNRLEVLAPDCYARRFLARHKRYSRYHERAYLQPARFTPKENILRDVGARPNEPYTVVCLMTWREVTASPLLTRVRHAHAR